MMKSVGNGVLKVPTYLINKCLGKEVAVFSAAKLGVDFLTKKIGWLFYNAKLKMFDEKSPRVNALSMSINISFILQNDAHMYVTFL